ncbi:hypothetical protein BD413DRAFT_500118, partial [Trametes elegans]
MTRFPGVVDLRVSIFIFLPLACYNVHVVCAVVPLSAICGRLTCCRHNAERLWVRPPLFHVVRPQLTCENISQLCQHVVADIREPALVSPGIHSSGMVERFPAQAPPCRSPPCGIEAGVLEQQQTRQRTTCQGATGQSASRGLLALELHHRLHADIFALASVANNPSATIVASGDLPTYAHVVHAVALHAFFTLVIFIVNRVGLSSPRARN